MPYEGWEIYAYADKVSQRVLEKIKAELKRRFSDQAWLYGENARESAIIHRLTQSEIKVQFGEYTFQNEQDPADVETFHVKLEAPFSATDMTMHTGDYATRSTTAYHGGKEPSSWKMEHASQSQEE